jgi:endo-1,4-beta-xylanase
MGLPYKHHVLVWGSQQPGWVDGLDPTSQRAEVENWIRLVGLRYPKMSFVDVLNEPFHTPLPSYKDALGGDGTTGWDWVITAFQWARQYCAPGVKLHLNEYNILGSTSATTNYLTIINLLKDRGLIDGIGVQGHYFEFRSHIGSTTGTYVYDLATIKNNLNRLTATGLPVYITEFDIDEAIDSNQVAQYKIYFPILWANPGVKGITLWGYKEDDIWTSHPDTYLIYANGRERPALQWLRTYVASPLPPTLVSPVTVNGTQRNPPLLWRSSAFATSYHVQVSDNSTFVGFAVDTTVADTLLPLSPLAANTRYYWRVSAVDSAGASDYSTMASFITGELISDVASTGTVPNQFQLSQNYPNPFNPSTAISFRLSAVSNVTLQVFDALGREVATLANGERSPGEHTTMWDATGFPGGVYFYELTARGNDGSTTFRAAKKLLLVK